MATFSSWIISHLWTGIWQGALLIALVWTVCRFAKDLNSKVRYWLYWLASLKLLFAFLPGWNINLLGSNDGVVMRSVASVQQFVYATGGAAVVPDAVTPSPTTAPLWPVIIAGVWTLGLLVGCALLFSEWLRVKRILAKATKITSESIGEQIRLLAVNVGLTKLPRVALSEETSSPFVTGILRPWLVLPKNIAESLTSSELEMAIAHELFHLKRRDLLMGVVPSLARLLFFFFPPAHVACREWATEREAVCDADAIALTSSSPSSYGNLLLKIVSGDHTPALSACVGVTSSFYTLKSRIARIKQIGQKNPSWLQFIAIPTVALSTILLMPWQCMPARANEKSANNLVKNSDFERGLQHWKELMPASRADVRMEIVDGGRAGKAISFTKSTSRFFPFSLYDQRLPDPPSTAKKIHFSAWIKAENVAKATLPLFLDTGPDTGDIKWGAFVGELNEGDSPVTHDWKKYESTFDLPSNLVDVRVGLEMYGPGKVWIDDVEVTYE